MMNSATKRGAWLLWIAAVGFLLALLFFPASYRLRRLASIALFAVVWFGLLALTWRSRLVRYLLLGISLLAVTFASLPRRVGSDTERLRQEYVVRLQHYEGVKYFWGGENGLGIDCSGLVRRGLINALFQRGVRTGDGGSIRDAADLWWHDCTASALGAGNGGQTVSVLDTPSVNALDHSSIVPGDLAVTSDGIHIMAYLGENRWIEADPAAGRVITVTAPSKDNGWFATPMRIVRWKRLD